MNRHDSLARGCRALAVGLLGLAALGAPPRASSEEPRWLRLDIPEWSLGMESEGLTENVSVNGYNSTHDQLSLTPLVGLRAKGSIYHPNLLTFDVIGEGGWSWLTDSVKSTSSSSTRNESGDLLRYLAQVNLLSGKPYTAFLSASRDHTYRNYDAFTTYTVDSTRYAGHADWRIKNLTLNADVNYRNEDSTGISGSTRFSEEYANFSGMQTRDTGQSSLNYRYSEYNTAPTSGGNVSSTTHAVGVSDSETFGSHRQISASTGAGYSQSEYSGQQIETFSATESITVKHRPTLDSFLNVNFSQSRLDPFISSYLQGQAGVRHQLYESLTSTLDAHGNYDESSGLGISASNSRYGLGLSEDYTKRLGDWGRLSLSGGITADHEEHKASGTVLPTIDERHNLTNAPVFLRNPQVITSTIQVRAALDNFPYGSADYTIVPRGELTEIRLVPGSMNVATHGSEVFVNYLSKSLYNAAFESLNCGAQIRLDLFGKFGIYGRLNWLDNNAPPEAITQTLTDLVGGLDYTWRGLRAGAEYEDYNSNFVQYQAWRFFQSYNYQTSEGSTLGLDFNQYFYRYPNSFNQDRYQFISRYDTLLTFSLAWHLEGGYALQNVTTTEQGFALARTGVTWTRGKLCVRAGYEYNYQTTTTGSSAEQRNRNYFYANLKRSF